MARLMSDAEIKRRKRLQGHISQTTGAIGLGALAGTMVASRAGRNTLRKIPKVERVLKKPPPKDPNRDRIKGALTPALATSAGIGGLGAFNFAAYTNAESRKRKMTEPVKKRDEMAPEYGEMAKAWTPQTTPYDPEAKRAKRNKVTQAGLTGGGIAALGGAGVQAGRAGRTKDLANKQEKVKIGMPRPKSVPKGEALSPGQARWAKGRQTIARGANAKKAAKLHRLASHQIKGAGKLAAVGTAAVAGGEYVRHRRKSTSWEPYAKRDSTSAFGVDHSDNPNGQHRETEN